MAMYDRIRDGESCTVEQAAQQAADYCARHPAWVRICDVPDYDALASQRPRMKAGVISGKGEFYDCITDVPLFHNSMMILHVGVKAANTMRAAHGKPPAAQPAMTVSAPALSRSEREHIGRGGRVLVVEKIAGPQWRVLCISTARGCRVLLKPQDLDGYSDAQQAFDHARNIAALSDDTPMVRPVALVRVQPPC